jgi:hypothetical protein
MKWTERHPHEGGDPLITSEITHDKLINLLIYSSNMKVWITQYT